MLIAFGHNDNITIYTNINVKINIHVNAKQ